LAEPNTAGGARAAGEARVRRAVVLLPIAVTLLAALWMHAAPANQLARTLPTEDAYYVLAVARHMGMGDGVTADGRIDANGFQPLWAVVNAPLYAVAGGDRITGLRLSQLLSTALWLAFLALLALHARELARRHGSDGRIAAAATLIVAGGAVSVFRLFHNGLETGLTLVLLAGAVLQLDRWETWTPRRVLLAGVVLGLLTLARVDEVAFVVAFGAVSVFRARHRLRDAVAPLAACAIAAVVLSPWIAWNFSLDGSPMPSSGKAESSGVDIAHNLDSALRAAGAWSLPPVLRPSMHFTEMPISEVLSVLALALVAAAVVSVRRRRRAPLGAGTTALIAFVAFLALFYVTRFGPWWFMERYLAPMLVLTIPWLATALELRRPSPRALPALVAIVLAANVPILVVLASGDEHPPAWTARDSNLGAHPNLNVTEQLAWIDDHVNPRCVVGAFETGTLLYFRERTVNLDGKVDHDALEARLNGGSFDYVDKREVDVMVDIESGPPRGLRPGSFHKVEDMGRYEAWVRNGRDRACLAGSTDSRGALPPWPFARADRPHTQVARHMNGRPVVSDSAHGAKSSTMIGGSGLTG